MISDFFFTINKRQFSAKPSLLHLYATTDTKLFVLILIISLLCRVTVALQHQHWQILKYLIKIRLLLFFFLKVHIALVYVQRICSNHRSFASRHTWMEQAHLIRHYAGDCFTDPTLVFPKMKSECLEVKKPHCCSWSHSVLAEYISGPLLILLNSNTDFIEQQASSTFTSQAVPCQAVQFFFSRKEIVKSPPLNIEMCPSWLAEYMDMQLLQMFRIKIEEAKLKWGGFQVVIRIKTFFFSLLAGFLLSTRTAKVYTPLVKPSDS